MGGQNKQTNKKTTQASHVKTTAQLQEIHRVLQNPACPFCSKARGKLLMSQQAAGSRLRERGRDGRKEGRKHSPGWDALCWLHTPTEPRETLGHLLGSTPGSSTSGPGLSQQHHAAQPELSSTMQLRSWRRWDRGDQRGRSHHCPGGAAAVHPLPLTPPPGFVPSCCHSTFCFPFKQGHSNDARRDLRRQEYLGTLPARSSLPARPPAVRTFTGSGVYSTY